MSLLLGNDPSLQPYICGGILVPLANKDGGVPPLVVGDLLRAITSKVAVQNAASAAEDLHPLQVGVWGK